uniref:Uncharacterized protein n=1 Tax=Denticeps clupeoides TaxID=299321 RepID=A0AAY4C3B6_9TELE
MNARLALILHCCCLATLGRGAPLVRTRRDAEEQARSLVAKILRDIPAAHDASVTVTGFVLRQVPSNLQFMARSLDIPPAPVLRAQDATFTKEMCLERIAEGLQLHLRLLEAVRARLNSAAVISNLEANIKDLLVQIRKMEGWSSTSNGVRSTVTDLSSRLTGDYEVQVAAHLTLSQLLSFTQNVSRSLHNITHHKA